MTGTDAFWLGLIDEVVGVKDLPSLRLMVEFASQQKAKDEETEAASEEAAEPVGAEAAGA
ncbi:MAG TPA: hypothetical protein VG148_18380 [Pyrinomonadaceae bacterium]|nr:hypothetical protein [Pyrinomonadaceae bacterium]